MFGSQESQKDASGKTATDQLPGLLPAVAISLISAILSWIWLTAPSSIRPGGGVASISTLTALDDREAAGAMTTLSDSSDFLGRYEESKKTCRLPLAWVSIAATGPDPIRVRIKSGSYFSPMFSITATPQRVAFPFPNSYEEGHGRLTVFVEGGGGLISLTPLQKILPQEGSKTLEVNWTPSQRCGGENG